MKANNSKGKLTLLTFYLFCNSSMACKPSPEVFNPQNYLQSNDPTVVVFSGTVNTIGKTKKTSDGQTQEIVFDTIWWWKGEEKKQVVVRAIQGTAAGTSCAGIFDFSVKPGESWKIFGRLRDGIVYPDSLLSQRENHSTHESR